MPGHLSVGWRECEIARPAAVSVCSSGSSSMADEVCGLKQYTVSSHRPLSVSAGWSSSNRAGDETHLTVSQTDKV